MAERLRLSQVRGPNPGTGLSPLWIVGILALLVPCFVGRSSSKALSNFETMQRKAKRSELPLHVDEIAAAEVRYHDATGSWLAIGSRAEALAEAPGTEQRVFLGGDAWDTLDWQPDAMIRGAYWVEVAGNGAVVHGVADVDGDGVLAEYAAVLPGKAEMLSAHDVY